MLVLLYKYYLHYDTKILKILRDFFMILKIVSFKTTVESCYPDPTKIGLTWHALNEKFNFFAVFFFSIRIKYVLN